ncbi:nicotinate phosphoribosyltransferase [Desulfopila sp. IMCC35008]|uniref:nicotinate phosphoribosyltransferase n=1 Tax=Desulfopila sp. IMCC35008 TaxID=2653858 RepID=UPI0013D492E9|nr:nicotinate phosphoribosyltransferase [Desulfopila sp. IMCC35008]
MIQEHSPLLTDLYQLTMMQAYYDKGMQEEAVFEFFFRDFPDNRRFLIACGLQQALQYLESIQFSDEDIDYLRRDGRFHDTFLNQLREFSFTGDIHAMAEGTIFFSHEPILRVTAPLPQAQLVETRLINILQFQTMIASKAARMTRLLPDTLLIDYGLRRSHGAEAGVMAARGAYCGGFAGTATVLAGKMFNIPTYGTMAHSFIQAHDSEEEAFYDFATSHPENCVLLLDTYNTERAVERVVTLSRKLKQQDITIKGVRLDSGDMVQLSKKVRTVLDENGLQEILIFASGDMDEYSLQKFVDNNAPVDGFGIGSKLTTSADHPYFDCAYKLVEFKGRGRRKLAESKSTWPGRKQVFRSFSKFSKFAGDILGLTDEQHGSTSLIHHYMKNGKTITPLPPLEEARAFAMEQMRQLPADIDRSAYRYPVTPSEKLEEYARQVTKELEERNR